MLKLSRKAALAAIKAAGATNDQQTFTRIYVENRISYEVAIAAFREGKSFAKFSDK